MLLAQAHCQVSCHVVASLLRTVSSLRLEITYRRPRITGSAHEARAQKASRTTLLCSSTHSVDESGSPIWVT
ncbi:hypothetical protein HDV57DRAFT_494679 [Trichoderma longibrachiatum]